MSLKEFCIHGACLAAIRRGRCCHAARARPPPGFISTFRASLSETTTHCDNHDNMHWLTQLVAVSCTLSQVANAIFADDAGIVDWHHVLLGLPLHEATFFHQPSPDSKASLIYTLSERNIVAAVNPKDGEVVWRQQLTDTSATNTPRAFFRAGHNSDSVVSGLHSEVVAWGAPDGRQIWSTHVGEAVIGDLEILELDDGLQKIAAKDVLVLAESSKSSVLRLSGSDGSKIWEYTDESGDLPHQLSASATQVFYVALHPSGSSSRIRVTVLDPMSGKKLEQHTLSDSDIADASHVLTVGSNSASPIIAWTDKAYTTLKINVIGAKSVATFNIAKSSGEEIETVLVHAPSRHNSRPHFLVQYQSTTKSWAEVYHVDVKKSSVSKAYDLPKISGRSAFSATSEGSNVFFTRITNDEVIVMSSASHGVLSRWQHKGFVHGDSAIPKDAQPLLAATELSVQGEEVSAARSAVLLSSGDWISLRDDTIAWSRPEELAYTIVAAYAYPPVADKEYQNELNKETELNVVSAYFYRLTRHIAELQKLPAFLVTIPSRLLGSVGLAEKPHADISTAVRNFGFHKVIVGVTDTGTAFGLDAGEGGKILWRSVVPEKARAKPGVQAYLEAFPDGAMEFKPSMNAVSRMIFDGTTGKILTNLPATHFQKVLNIKNTNLGVDGLQPANLASKKPTPPRSWWQFKTLPEEVVVGMVSRPNEDPVASVGRVLGDRRVLYKYLNPNLLLVATAPKDRSTLSVRLFDSFSGAVIYSATHSGVVSSFPFAAVVSENWFVYSYTEDSGETGVKSTLLVVGEMYESATPDDHGAANISDEFLPSNPYIPLQTYIIPEPISHITVTQTGQGITSKELIVTLPGSNALVGIPKAIIDPRRPIGRDPNKIEQFEGLMKYVPTLEFDPKWYLSHQRELFGIRNVTTSPAILESTSLVFAYGLDIFGTRVSPSFSFDILGKDFNKLQMLATVFALGVGTFVVAPLVSCSLCNSLHIRQSD